MKRKLFTIGYTGFSVQEFVDKLTNTGVACLIDTREIPISRKRGFAKTALRKHLDQAGIAYHHFRLLGSPRAVRHELRETGDYEKFFGKVRRHIASVEATSAIREAIEIARTTTSCLMCCCADWQLCHRRCVVEAITTLTGFLVEHLDRSSSQLQLRKAA